MKARLLIAEDDADMRDLLQEVLEEAGYDVLVAADGRAALAHVEREREQIDLVITDVRMPGLAGDELLSKVRERRAEAPVIVITAFGSVEQAVEMVKAGAYQYLTKPFQTGELLGAVKQALEVREGRFRDDLYWRLNVIQVRVPPLRERPFDIPLLVEHFITEAAEANRSEPLKISPEALAVLTAYSWPGNVRELENAVERAVAFARGTVLTPEDLPERVRRSGVAASLIARSSARGLTLAELEREYIIETLRRAGGNKSRAAEMLGLDRKTLYRKLDEYRASDPSLEI